MALPFGPGGAEAGAEAAVVLAGPDMRLGAASAVDYLVKGTSLKTTLSAVLPLASNPACPEVAIWCNALLVILQALPLSTKVKVA